MKVDREQNVWVIVSLLRFVILACRYFYSRCHFLSLTRRNASLFWCFMISTHHFLSLARHIVCLICQLISLTRRFAKFAILAIHRFIMVFHRFNSSTSVGYSIVMYITWSIISFFPTFLIPSVPKTKWIRWKIFWKIAWRK